MKLKRDYIDWYLKELLLGPVLAIFASVMIVAGIMVFLMYVVG
jgi:hypothetical protein